MTLVLQTNIDQTVGVWLVRGKKLIDSAIIASTTKRVVPLEIIHRLMARQKVSTDALRKIVIIRGPGRFSAVRTGLLIANYLAQELRIPIRGVVSKNILSDERVISLAQQRTSSSRRPILPWYGKKPNITKPSRVTTRKKR